MPPGHWLSRTAPEPSDSSKRSVLLVPTGSADRARSLRRQSPSQSQMQTRSETAWNRDSLEQGRRESVPHADATAAGECSRDAPFQRRIDQRVSDGSRVCLSRPDYIRRLILRGSFQSVVDANRRQIGLDSWRQAPSQRQPRLHTSQALHRPAVPTERRCGRLAAGATRLLRAYTKKRWLGGTVGRGAEHSQVRTGIPADCAGDHVLALVWCRRVVAPRSKGEVPPPADVRDVEGVAVRSLHVRTFLVVQKRTAVSRCPVGLPCASGRAHTSSQPGLQCQDPEPPNQLKMSSALPVRVFRCQRKPPPLLLSTSASRFKLSKNAW